MASGAIAIQPPARGQGRTCTGYCQGGGSEEDMSHGTRSSHTALGWHSPRRPSMPAVAMRGVSAWNAWLEPCARGA